jgi:hypothetical protein
LCNSVFQAKQIGELNQTIGYKKMYYESAENQAISKKRAIQELEKHGIDDTTEFFNDLGNMTTYQAQTVLEWLGY